MNLLSTQSEFNFGKGDRGRTIEEDSFKSMFPTKAPMLNFSSAHACEVLSTKPYPRQTFNGEDVSSSSHSPPPPLLLDEFQRSSLGFVSGNIPPHLYLQAASEHDQRRYFDDGVTSGRDFIACHSKTTGGSFPPAYKTGNSTSGRKERRRTHNINSAFSALRNCIPNVPSDTKLSKIKTLRLATSYISYLMDVLSKDDPNSCGSFNAEIAKKSETRKEAKKRDAEVLHSSRSPPEGRQKRSSKTPRTGWPQQVWAAEFNSEKVDSTHNSDRL